MGSVAAVWRTLSPPSLTWGYDYTFSHLSPGLGTDGCQTNVVSNPRKEPETRRRVDEKGLEDSWNAVCVLNVHPTQLTSAHLLDMGTEIWPRPA